MTNEEAARLLDPETNLAAMEELQYYHGFAWQEILVKALREARKMGADELRNTGCSRGEPLTLEQLREMIGDPVYLYIYDTALDSGWHIIKAVTEDKIIFRGWNTVYVPISSLGKCFDLYAYPPARIDRETWEPCELCEKQRKVFNEKFCGECGRPLTEEAWAELERRISRKEEQ